MNEAECINFKNLINSDNVGKPDIAISFLSQSIIFISSIHSAHRAGNTVLQGTKRSTRRHSRYIPRPSQEGKISRKETRFFFLNQLSIPYVGHPQLLLTPLRRCLHRRPNDLLHDQRLHGKEHQCRGPRVHCSGRCLLCTSMGKKQQSRIVLWCV